MDFKSGNFPVGVVVFGLIALLLALRLRSVLGRRSGLDAPPHAPRVDLSQTRQVQTRPDAPGRGRFGALRNPLAARRPGAPAELPRQVVVAAPEAPTSYVLPESGSSAGQTLVTLNALIAGFDAGAFLHGAERAFRRVVEAFAAGDRATLRPLLSDDTFEAFDQAIAAREAARETQHAEIRHIAEVALIGASVGQTDGATRPSLEVRFVSDQVSYVSGPNGDPVSGADAVTELCDIWTFEAAGDGVPANGVEAGRPAWRVSGTRSA